MEKARSCAVVGLGNIGSHAARLVAALPCVARVVLVDFDEVEEKNLSAQWVRRSAVGKSKALVAGRRLSALRPELAVTAHATRLEALPLGEFRVDVILGCLDSRSARMALNEYAVALGVPLVDAGVSAAGLLARVSVFGGEGPCLECAWDAESYANVETAYACAEGQTATVPTSAPAFLGATAAALQVAACEEILRGETEGIGKEMILDLTRRRLLVSSIGARSTCRMAPHQPLRIERFPVVLERFPLEAALALVPARESGEVRSIQCARGPFVTRLRCRACGAERRLLRLAASLSKRDRECRGCGGEVVAGGMDLRERLEVAFLGRADLGRSLASLGARIGDVLSIQAGSATRHFEMAAPDSASSLEGFER